MGIDRVIALTDRLVIDATDIAAAWLEKAFEEADAADRAAVMSAATEVTGDGRAERRLDLWATKAATRWRTEVAAVQEHPIRAVEDFRSNVRAIAAQALDKVTTGTMLDRLWATAELLACAAEVNDYRWGDRWGLSAMLTAASPEGERAWESGIVVDRPQRFGIKAVIEGGDLVFWTSMDIEGERWDSYVDHYQLPVPLSLADRFAALWARYRELSDEGNMPPEFRPELNRIWAESRLLLPRFQAALGPAYTVS